jgi:hypothetical protein
MGAYEYAQIGDADVQHSVRVSTYPNVTTDPELGVYYVIGHENFMVTFTPAAGYSLANMKVTTGSVWQDERGYMDVIYNEDGSVTVIFNQVTDPLDIRLTGVGPVSNELIGNVYALWSSKGHLVVKTAKAGTVSVYNMTGVLVKQLDVNEGETLIPLSQGVYVVSFDDGFQQKVVVK